jgi:hypothetical protein
VTFSNRIIGRRGVAPAGAGGAPHNPNDSASRYRVTGSGAGHRRPAVGMAAFAPAAPVSGTRAPHRTRHKRSVHSALAAHPRLGAAAPAPSASAHRRLSLSFRRLAAGPDPGPRSAPAVPVTDPCCSRCPGRDVGRDVARASRAGCVRWAGNPAKSRGAHSSSTSTSRPCCTGHAWRPDSRRSSWRERGQSRRVDPPWRAVTSASASAPSPVPTKRARSGLLQAARPRRDTNPVVPDASLAC